MTLLNERYDLSTRPVAGVEQVGIGAGAGDQEHMAGGHKGRPYKFEGFATPSI